MNKNDIPLNIMIDQDLRERLIEHSAEQERSIAATVRRILRKALTNPEDSEKQTEAPPTLST